MTITQLPLPAELPDTAMSSVSSHPTYAAAQQAVDYLSDHDFPVRHAAIIGTDLHLVETGTGRPAVARAAASGAGGGAWLGLLIGALLVSFTTGDWLVVLSLAVAGGATWGAGTAVVAHVAAHGKGRFAPCRHLAAARYEVVVAADHAEHAGRLLTQHVEVMQYTWHSR